MKRHIWLAALVALAAAPQVASAQSWVRAPNSTDVSFQYGFLYDNGALTGTEVGLQGEDLYQAHTLSLGVDYATPLPRLALSASLPLVFSKVMNTTFIPHGHYDDGSTHAALTDLGLQARYQLPVQFMNIAPSIGTVLPLTQYETMGHGAAGKGLKEARLGLSFGRDLGFLRNAFFEANYSYSFVERVAFNAETAKININRSDASLDFGYFFSPSIVALAGSSFRYTHGGIEIQEVMDASNKITAGETVSDREMGVLMAHDQLSDEKYITARVGFAYSPIPSVSIQATASKIVWGYLTGNAWMGNLGVSYSL